MKPINIDKFINEIAPRLPFNPKIIRYDKTAFTGAELKLTGVTEYKGEPIQDDKAYVLDVPVYEARMEGDQPVIKSPDHREELRKVFITKGLIGVYGYLRPYLSEASLKQVQDHFMKINK
jgi:hypothetical protein